MKKEVIFQYGSGPAPIAVGQTVLYYHYNNRGHMTELVVDKIGRDLVHFKGRNNPFYRNGEEKTQYTRGTLFPSREVYDRYIKERDFIRAVEDRLERNTMTFEQAKHINEFMGFEIKLK